MGNNLSCYCDDTDPESDHGSKGLVRTQSHRSNKSFEKTTSRSRDPRSIQQQSEDGGSIHDTSIQYLEQERDPQAHRESDIGFFISGIHSEFNELKKENDILKEKIRDHESQEKESAIIITDLTSKLESMQPEMDGLHKERVQLRKEKEEQAKKHEDEKQALLQRLDSARSELGSTRSENLKLTINLAKKHMDDRSSRRSFTSDNRSMISDATFESVPQVPESIYDSVKSVKKGDQVMWKGCTLKSNLTDIIIDTELQSVQILKSLPSPSAGMTHSVERSPLKSSSASFFNDEVPMKLQDNPKIDEGSSCNAQELAMSTKEVSNKSSDHKEDHAGKVHALLKPSNLDLGDETQVQDSVNPVERLEESMGEFVEPAVVSKKEAEPVTEQMDPFQEHPGPVLGKDQTEVSNDADKKVPQSSEQHQKVENAEKPKLDPRLMLSEGYTEELDDLFDDMLS